MARCFSEVLCTRQTNCLHQLLHFFLLLYDFFAYWVSFSLHAAVYFLYDLSPITVTIREERRNFLHFITRLCAVLGGTFALTGLPLIFSCRIYFKVKFFDKLEVPAIILFSPFALLFFSIESWT